MKVVLGLGCDRGTPQQTIEGAVRSALAEADVSEGDVIAAASIDKKSDEDGLLSVCERHGWPLSFYPAEALAGVEVPNPSEVVRKYTGTPAVAEAAAILAAGGTMADLLVEKYRRRGEDGKNATVSVCKTGTSTLSLKGES